MTLTKEVVFQDLPLEIEAIDDGNATYDSKFFQDWIDTLEAKLRTSTPPSTLLKNQKAFGGICQLIQSTNQSKRDAEHLRDEISKQKPVNKDLIDKIKAIVDTEQKALDDAMDLCQRLSEEVLNLPDIQNLLNDKYDDKDFLVYVILKQAGVTDLAAWCQRGDMETNQLLDFLHKDVALQRQFLQAGGARKGEYGVAVQLYRRISSFQVQKNSVLQKLALAVALELCSPLALFDRASTFVDPIQRYVHYEQAYLYGELDPAFEHFQVWEMRNIVNCNATDEELGWGRQCLMNYRPDIVNSNDPTWRYCAIVRTDVAYKNPDWYQKPHSYDQILAGGGKCGPRAWYGRFICKAFGIPTWGFTQPGHAALSRWTSQGWVTILGAGFPYAAWEGRGGLDFELETKARYSLKNDEAEYLRKVLRLQWIGLLNKEDNSTVKSQCLPSPSNLWCALELMQRKTLVAKASTLPTIFHQKNPTGNRILMIRSMPNLVVQPAFRDGDTIIIPASSPSKPTNETKTVKFLKSFLGGRQLLLVNDATVEYTLDVSLFATAGPPQQYQLSCRVCTVHRQEEPLLVQMTVLNAQQQRLSADSLVSIDIPYTMGMWQETEPVLIGSPGNASVTAFKLTVTRQSKQFAISIKDLKLVPVP